MFAQGMQSDLATCHNEMKRIKYNSHSVKLLPILRNKSIDELCVGLASFDPAFNATA